MKVFQIVITAFLVLFVVLIISIVRFGIGYMLGWVIMKIFNVGLDCCYLPVITGLGVLILGLFSGGRK